jgi:hypothetical protein
MTFVISGNFHSFEGSLPNPIILNTGMSTKTMLRKLTSSEGPNQHH